jgi:hypothetical protein
MEHGEAVTDASGLYVVERRAYYAQRPGFKIGELQISPTQKVAWHFHNRPHLVTNDGQLGNVSHPTRDWRIRLRPSVSKLVLATKGTRSRIIMRQIWKRPEDVRRSFALVVRRRDDR